MRTFIIAAALAAAFAALPARAGIAAPGPTAKVRYADLDLANPRDTARLDRRIAAAIEEVCGSYASAPRDQEDEITACRKAAMTGYRSQLARIAGATRFAGR